MVRNVRCSSNKLYVCVLDPLGVRFIRGCIRSPFPPHRSFIVLVTSSCAETGTMRHPLAFACDIRCHLVKVVITRPTCAACLGSRGLTACSSVGMAVAATASAVQRRLQAVVTAAAPTDPSDDLPVIIAGNEILRQVSACLPMKGFNCRHFGHRHPYTRLILPVVTGAIPVPSGLPSTVALFRHQSPPH